MEKKEQKVKKRDAKKRMLEEKLKENTKKMKQLK